MRETTRNTNCKKGRETAREGEREREEGDRERESERGREGREKERCCVLTVLQRPWVVRERA